MRRTWGTKSETPDSQKHQQPAQHPGNSKMPVDWKLGKTGSLP
jgi:hypothetical protein